MRIPTAMWRYVAAMLAVGALVAVVSGPAGCAVTSDPGTESDVVAIINGRLFDATGTTALDDGVVVFEGNRIVAVGPASTVEVPAGAHVIDAAGGTIMPGVIDNHMHAFWPNGAMLTGDEDTLTPWLQSGVTTLVDTGTIRHTLRPHRALANSVAYPPRFFMAGPLITVPGGYPTTRREDDIAMYAWTIEGPDEAYEVTAKLIDEEGADLVKIAVETGFDTDYDSTEGWPTLSMDEIEAVVRAAHERGRLVRAHVTNPLELLAAAQAGVDVAAHTPIHEIPDEVLDEVATYEMIFISTANIWGWPRRERGRPVGPNLYRYHQRGGVVAMGTDVPYQRGSIMPVGEMQLFIDAGFTPAEVLVASTRNSAKALGMEAELGTLEVGKLADIIVVDGDPLADIEAMANVTVVVRDGEIIPMPSSPAER